MKRFLLFLALVAVVAPALLLANPQDTVWVKNTGRTIEALAVSPDSKYIVVGEANPNAYVSVRDIQNGNELFQLPGWSYYYNMLFSKNGKYLLYGYGDTMRIVDCSTWTIKYTLQNAGFLFRFSNDENYVVITHSGAKDSVWFNLFNLETGIIEKKITKTECPILQNLKTCVATITNPVQNILYFVSQYKNLYALNIDTYQSTLLSNNASPYSYLAISNDGTLLAFETNESETDKIIVMNTVTKEFVCRVPGKNHDNVVSSVSGIDFSSDNRFLAFNSNGTNTIEIWEVLTNLKKYTYIYTYQFVEWANNDKWIVEANGKELIKFKTDKFTDLPFQENFEKIYPNPTNNLVNIPITSSNGSQVIIEINDMSGRRIKSFNNILSDGNNTIQIDVSDLSTGEYILKVFKGIEILTYKLIINK